MQMHEGGQIKTIPIRRIGHATHETIYPLTHSDVDVHGGADLGVSLSYGW